MGRRNSRGLELTFKPVKGSRGRGRWLKKINRRACYFGWGDGVTDRASYLAALKSYRAWLSAQALDRTALLRSGITRRLQHEFSVLDGHPERLDLGAARAQVERLRGVGGASSEMFARLADAEEKRRLIGSLRDRPLDDIRRAFTAESAPPKTATSGELLDEFLQLQRQRMGRRQKLDQLREAGQAVKEPAKQNLSPGRFAAIARDVAAMKRIVGAETWDGTEATAARVVRKFRDESDALVLSGTHSPHSFNDRIKLARMFCAWAEATYQLDRMPRNRSLFSKYLTTESSAKAIPLDTLRKLWNASDDRGRCWLLLGLNCAYYAQDISDLTRAMIEGGYLHHNRGKTGAKVRYKLWAKTRHYLKKFARGSGRVFTTEKGTPLVYYSKLKKTGDPVRVDNVRNWFFRLCNSVGVAGFSFSNVRDTASTEVENIDRGLNDLFLAHRDQRMRHFMSTVR
jgi:hypothetical protein